MDARWRWPTASPTRCGSTTPVRVPFEAGRSATSSAIRPPAYSDDGSLLVYPAGQALAVRDARTLALRKRLPIGPPFSEQLTADVPEGSILIGPGERTVYYAYWLLNPAGQPTDAYLSRWALPSGRRAPDRASRVRARCSRCALVDRGADLIVVTAHDIDTYDAHTLRLVQSVPIRPVPAAAGGGRDQPRRSHGRDRIPDRLGVVRRRGHRRRAARCRRPQRRGGQRRVRARRQHGDDRRRRR